MLQNFKEHYGMLENTKGNKENLRNTKNTKKL